MVYNDVLKREIPEGWEVESIADNKLSKILKPGIKQFDGQKIYLPTAAVENDRIIDKSNLITYDNREGRANMEPVDNSVWFAKMKNTKKVLYFGDYSSQRISQTILSTGMLGLKCVENALEYIWNFVNDDSFEAVKNKLSHGATQEGVNNDDLLYFPMLIPSIETLRNYSVLVKDLYKQKYFNEIENECLAELRDFLLPMLMNGQVSVS
jgi:type I restriction enzyme S subunit